MGLGRFRSRTMPRVRIRDGPNRGSTYTASRKPILIGRDTDCTIQILDKGASRHHAEIFRVGDMNFVRDLGSRNGTFVNEERVQEELLREGDRILIGSTMLVFEAAPAQGRSVQFVDGSEEMSSSTLELRLDDVAGLEEEESEGLANFRAIYRLGRLLSSERDPDAAAERALAFLAGEVPAEQAFLFMREDRPGSGRSPAQPSAGPEEAFALGASEDREGAQGSPSARLVTRARYERSPTLQPIVSRAIVSKCLKETRSILTTNAMADARFKDRESVILKRIRSVICAPVLGYGEVSGVLYMATSRLSDPFVEEDLELVTAAAPLVGLRLEGLEAERRQRQTLTGAVRSLVSLAEMRNPATRGHSERVTGYAVAMAEQMGSTAGARTSLRLAALLHDIGKISVPEEELATRDTRDLKRGDPATAHVHAGAELARSIVGAEEVPAAVLHHHESYDGSGYPEGLAGDAIPLFARLIAAADHLDHLALGRSAEASAGGTQPGPGPDMTEAVGRLEAESGRRLDPDVVRAAAAALRSGGLHLQGPVAAGAGGG